MLLNQIKRLEHGGDELKEVRNMKNTMKQK